MGCSNSNGVLCRVVILVIVYYAGLTVMVIVYCSG